MAISHHTTSPARVVAPGGAVINAELQRLCVLHAQGWDLLGSLDDDESWQCGPEVIERLRRIEETAWPMPVYSLADLAAKAVMAASYIDSGEAPPEVVEALVSGICSVVRAAGQGRGA